MRSSTLSGRQVCLATISVGIPERPCLPAIAASLHSDCRVAPPVLPCPSAYIGMARFEKKCTRVHTLIRTDTRAIGSDQNEIRTFLTVRNEMLRLPWTLEHYRNRSEPIFCYRQRLNRRIKGVSAGAAGLPRFHDSRFLRRIDVWRRV